MLTLWNSEWGSESLEDFCKDPSLSELGTHSDLQIPTWFLSAINISASRGKKRSSQRYTAGGGVVLRALGPFFYTITGILCPVHNWLFIVFVCLRLLPSLLFILWWIAPFIVTLKAPAVISCTSWPQNVWTLLSLAIHGMLSSLSQLLRWTNPLN